eukprot:GDKI01038639.1.p1 GENE.GDKI01038639.1~~GDKI01038639.1.p1  ORF type:complete len:202 (+),score=83.47 GDKI01038639.1:46-606(+)
MVKVKVDPTLAQKVHQFQIVGRAAPTQKKTDPKVFRMRMFARDQVQAKSKFWYFMKKIQKAKKTGGEILSINEIHEKNPNTIKNFAIWLRYDSRTGTHNMYKEYRDTTQNGAVSQMYSEMAGRHRALASNIQIINIAAIPASKCRRLHMLEILNSKLRFPLIRRIPMAPKALRSTFNAHRPTTFLQ